MGYSYTFNNVLYGHPAGSGGPYAVRNTDYQYDNNGNMTSQNVWGQIRTYAWNTENQPTQISFQGTTETYTYDADGARIKKTRGFINTYYIGGLSEEDKPTGIGNTTTRSIYTFNGQVVAQRTIGSSNTLVYLHSDHLGSVGASTTSAGASLSSQEYDPWGKVRTGGVTQTKYNYTGQKLDDTGLLFYNARYYDPGLGRFTSPDSIVPTTNNALQADFHEGGQTANQTALNRKQAYPGPKDPQGLNRFSYVGNNPLVHSDPTGHCRDANGEVDETCSKDKAKKPTSTAVSPKTTPAPSPAPTVPKTATPPPGPSLPEPPDGVSEDLWVAFLYTLAYAKDYIMENADFMADLQRRFPGSDIKKWQIDPKQSLEDTLNNPNRTGDTRLYIQFVDEKGYSYQVSVDATLKSKDGIRFHDAHFSSGPQKWRGQRPKSK